MKTNNLFKRILCMILPIILIIPSIIIKPGEAASKTITKLIYKDAIIGDQCDDPEAITDVTSSEPDIYIDTKSQTNNWYVLHDYDHLPYNEIHKRVQNNIWTNPNNTVDHGEKRIDYANGKYGFADISYENEDDNVTYLWEVKPPSYRDKNKSKGFEQLTNYVNAKPNYKYGYKSPGNIHDSSFSFNLTLECFKAGYVWEEYVTYYVEYEQLDNGLIIYDFKRKAKKTPKAPGVPVPQKERQEAENGAFDYSKDPVNLEDEEPSFGRERRRSGGYFPSPITQPAYSSLVSTAYMFGKELGIYFLDEYGKKIVIVSAATLAAAYVAATTLASTHTPTVDKTSHSGSIEAAATSYISAYDSALLGGDADYLLWMYNHFMSYNPDIPNNEDEDGSNEENDDNNSGNEEMKDHENDYEAAEEQPPTRDPLAIHLNSGEMIELTSRDEGVYFDLDSNGFAEKTAWLGTEDGFLALDVNGNGIIDNGSELFGDRFIMPDGNVSATGFEALLSLDDNDDSIINENDNCFGSLMIWIDADHNGITGSDELKTLSELGITAFDLRNIVHEAVSYEEIAVESESAKIVFENSSERKISEFLLPVHSADTMHNGAYTNGNVLNIDQALYEDESGELAELCFRFCIANSVEMKKYYLKKILYKITDSDDIDRNSRGENIDARDLHVIEQFMGHGFNGTSGTTPNIFAAAMLRSLYNSIENIYYNYLIIQFNGNDLKTYVTVQQDDEGNVTINTALLEYILDICIDNGTDVEVCLYDFGKYLKYLDKKHCTDAYTAFKDKYTAVSPKFAQLFNNMDNYPTTFGSDENDTITGINSNDIIYGGKGDDTLYGGSGNDTYIFNLGDGNDTISEENTSSSSDKIIFGEGITIDDIAVSRENDDIIIHVGDNSDSIRINDFYYRAWSNDYRVENFVFADGTEKTSGYLESIPLTITGSGVIKDFTSGAGVKNSTLIGSDDNDEIYGYEGNDTFIGGKGDDTLYGGSGNDTYIFNLGDGNDTISEESTSSSSDKIIFGEGITVDDIAISRENDDIIIHIGDNGDSIRINDFYYRAWGNDYRVEVFEFTDGNVSSIDCVQILNLNEFLIAS